MGETPLTLDALQKIPLPMPEEGGKEQRGTVLVLGGSAELPGAILLAGTAALRAGAGRLRIATVESVAVATAVALPEARVIGLRQTSGGQIDPTEAARLPALAQRCDALLIGPGLGPGAATDALVLSLLSDGPPKPCVLDAGALSGLGAHAETMRACGGRGVITPHAGEMAQLLGMEREAVEADPRGAAARAAELLGCVVIMKGARSWIVDPAGAHWLYPGGGVGLATSGSGDVLSGIIGGLLARGVGAMTAALWGVYLHGQAGRRLAARIGPLGFLARELPGEVPTLLRESATAASAPA